GRTVVDHRHQRDSAFIAKVARPPRCSRQRAVGGAAGTKPPPARGLFWAHAAAPPPGPAPPAGPTRRAACTFFPSAGPPRLEATWQRFVDWLRQASVAGEFTTQSSAPLPPALVGALARLTKGAGYVRPGWCRCQAFGVAT